MTIRLRSPTSSNFTTVQVFPIDIPKSSPCVPYPAILNFTLTAEAVATAGFKDGDRVVLQADLSGHKGGLYACADVVIGTPATPLPPRTDAGLATIRQEDITPTDPCSLGDEVIAQCPNLVCPNLPLSRALTSTAPVTAAPTSAVTSTRPSGGSKAVGVVSGAAAAVVVAAAVVLVGV
ncbi:hypothetical protein HDU67_010281 [Dinochytrium kinnereticum]|nr:hypothetical protein HDU67_010281 [Dinochytrium kinnereticum]